MNQPQRLSNNIDSFISSGLYPGGTGIIQDFCFKLWDYNGTQPPDSNCAVYCLLQPVDGSNDGKPVEIYWNVGPAKDFLPDHTGGFLVSNTRQGISNGCNWHDVLQALVNTCGLDRTMLDREGYGIRIMNGGEMTVVRKDQASRDFQDDRAQPQPGQQPGQQQRKRTFLSPTRFRGTWEGGGRAGMVVPGYQPPAAPAMPMASPYPTAPYPTPGPNGPIPAPMVAPVPAPVPQYQPVPQYTPPPQMAPPSPVPAPGPVPFLATSAAPGPLNPALVLRDIIRESGGMVTLADLPRKAIDKTVSLTPPERLQFLQHLAEPNLPALAQSIGAVFDGNLKTVSGGV